MMNHFTDWRWDHVSFHPTVNIMPLLLYIYSLNTLQDLTPLILNSSCLWHVPHSLTHTLTNLPTIVQMAASPHFREDHVWLKVCPTVLDQKLIWTREDSRSVGHIICAFFGVNRINTIQSVSNINQIKSICILKIEQLIPSLSTESYPLVLVPAPVCSNSIPS